jgi:hypothetical protein
MAWLMIRLIFGRAFPTHAADQAGDPLLWHGLQCFHGREIGLSTVLTGPIMPPTPAREAGCYSQRSAVPA